MYRIHRYYFVRDSPYFASRLPAPDIQSGRTTFSPTDETWAGITGTDLDAFLSILFPLDFDSCDVCSVEGWTSVLHLSTKWGFTSIRKLALRNLVNITDALPAERLRLGREYAVEEWIIPALTALCKRPTCPDLKEVRRMTNEDVAVVWTVREAILISEDPVDDTDFACQIKSWIKLNTASVLEPLHGSESLRAPDAAVLEGRKDSLLLDPKPEEHTHSPDDAANPEETALPVLTVGGAVAPVELANITASTSPPLPPPPHSFHPVPSENYTVVSEVPEKEEKYGERALLGKKGKKKRRNPDAN
ncbi:hypothetical protein BV25DRAFT_1827787 [Artomyces pyxidatus]|uniref:Uncharacterized protein n=1 Tax=Artomyces pyxidatus TaxID=48021 RepID=A0ACB8SXN1_9AGAM|nr:hypothetical protein BV25DRAFT_1827787 [Artomyces pyxidatus]